MPVNLMSPRPGLLFVLRIFKGICLAAYFHVFPLTKRSSKYWVNIPAKTLAVLWISVVVTVYLRVNITGPAYTDVATAHGIVVLNK